MASRRHKRTRLSTASSPQRGTLRLALVLAVLVGVNLYVFLWRGDTSIPAVMEQAAMAGHEDSGKAENSAEGKGEGEEAAEDGEAEAEAEIASGEPRWVDGEVQSGDSMGGILRREGMTPPEADELIRALRDHMDLRKIRPGQSYRLRFDAAGHLELFEFEVSRTTKVRAERDADGTLVGREDKAETEVRIEEIGGRVESSLHATMSRVGEDPSLVAFFADVFAYDVNFFTDTRAGDSFRIIVEKEYLEGDFYRYGRVLAAQYSGHVGTFDAFLWNDPRTREDAYYDSEGRSVEKSLLKTPLKFTRISSKFNPKRMHPVLHTERAHMGVDYAAPTGTPVWAAASGRIVGRRPMGGAGNCVILQHDNGLQTVYMHLSKFAKGQRVGEHVKSKTVIGYVGATGLATGPHLHFGVKEKGRYVDPMTLKMARGASVPRKYRAKFNAEMERLAERLRRVPVDAGQQQMLVQSGN
ncbi:M23 family metallopeptidase [Haliangium ochraceum]|uniref:M23 family metallopeptidase n=1 Tax=Haliangium ochraceum TaxID=80816 RepID=UPI00126A6954|nr:M23 family metallopeptidase [Haliangium ochraceum]